jgi:hypothetical protein
MTATEEQYIIELKISGAYILLQRKHFIRFT